ncbi:major coat protein [Vibrio ostreicida]|uniref:major coat protein n=1 Tax=Vibrio ostreicida TaxID=526588 RepID=UPI000970A0D5|nr:major coat protein [Vibrio ostreicida]
MNNNTYSKALLAVSLFTVAGVASAALPADAQAAMDSVSTFATDILAATWPIAITLTVGFIGIKLFKKGASKAT